MKTVHRKNIHAPITDDVIREGETMHEKIRRIMIDKEPITDGAPIIFTEKKDGVRPEFDIRTDKWDIAQNAMDKVAAAKIAKSKNLGKKEESGTPTGESAGESAKP